MIELAPWSEAVTSKLIVLAPLSSSADTARQETNPLSASKTILSFRSAGEIESTGIAQLILGVSDKELVNSELGIKSAFNCNWLTLLDGVSYLEKTLPSVPNWVVIPRCELFRCKLKFILSHTSVSSFKYALTVKG